MGKLKVLYTNTDERTFLIENNSVIDLLNSLNENNSLELLNYINDKLGDNISLVAIPNDVNLHISVESNKYY